MLPICDIIRYTRDKIVRKRVLRLDECKESAEEDSTDISRGFCYYCGRLGQLSGKIKKLSDTDKCQTLIKIINIMLCEEFHHMSGYASGKIIDKITRKWHPNVSLVFIWMDTLRSFRSVPRAIFNIMYNLYENLPYFFEGGNYRLNRRIFDVIIDNPEFLRHTELKPPTAPLIMTDSKTHIIRECVTTAILYGDVDTGIELTCAYLRHAINTKCIARPFMEFNSIINSSHGRILSENTCMALNTISNIKNIGRNHDGMSDIHIMSDIPDIDSNIANLRDELSTKAIETKCKILRIDPMDPMDEYDRPNLFLELSRIYEISELDKIPVLLGEYEDNDSKSPVWTRAALLKDWLFASTAEGEYYNLLADELLSRDMSVNRMLLNFVYSQRILDVTSSTYLLEILEFNRVLTTDIFIQFFMNSQYIYNCTMESYKAIIREILVYIIRNCESDCAKDRIIHIVKYCIYQSAINKGNNYTHRIKKSDYADFYQEIVHLVDVKDADDYGDDIPDEISEKLDKLLQYLRELLR